MRPSVFVYGSDDGRFVVLDRPILAFRREGYDWEAAGGMSSQNGRRNLTVEGATETNDGLQIALDALVRDRDMAGWWIKFDGPWTTVSDLLEREAFDWRRTRFFHGTSDRAWRSISRDGLCPRSLTGAGSAYGMKSSAKPGRPDATYITTQLDMAKFAARDAATAHGGAPIILEFTGLDPSLAEADEDSAEVNARASLDRLGSVAYLGCVAPDLLRVAFRLGADGWMAEDA